MFHSKHPAALLHATARMVSGSGIYVSDKPGAHDFELLKRMVLPDGSVLRPLLPGRPTKDILFADVLKDNKTLLKVCTTSELFWLIRSLSAFEASMLIPMVLPTTSNNAWDLRLEAIQQSKP